MERTAQNLLRLARRTFCTSKQSRGPSKQTLSCWQSVNGFVLASPSRKCLHTCSKRVKERSTVPSRYVRRQLTTSTGKPPVALINDLPRGYQEVVVDFNDGKATRFPSFWLRDHCLCPHCTHPQTQQRQLDTFSLDPETKATETESTDSGLKVIWTDNDHTSLYPWSWLKQHTPFTPFPPSYNPRGRWKHVSPSSPSYPTVDHASIMETDIGLATLLSQIRTYGFSFISDTPATTTATEALCNRIAHIRQTHYGGFWEVISKSDPIDTAYTNLHLPNHTDNTYFTEPCGLQLFHCLSHTPPDTSSSSTTTTTTSTGPPLGGESTLTDGFAAAQHLHSTNPQAYKLLSTVRIISHASGSPTAGPFLNNALHSQGEPVLTHLLPTSTASYHPRNLSQIRWNNDDRHSSTQFPNHQTMMDWYAAARAWNEIVHSREFEISVKLRPGVPVVFDNWRVLHGRKAFVGERRLCGAYIGMDDFLAKGRLLDDKVGEEEGEVDVDVKV